MEAQGAACLFYFYHNTFFPTFCFSAALGSQKGRKGVGVMRATTGIAHYPGCCASEDSAAVDDTCRARDFTGSREHSTQNSQSAASIELTSVQALRLLQKWYGALPAGSAVGRVDSRKQGMAQERLDVPPLVESLAESPRHVDLMRRSMGLALALPLLILGPWVNGVFASLATSLEADTGLVQAGAVESSVSRATQASMLRLGAFLMAGGFTALACKLLLTAPPWRIHSRNSLAGPV